MIFMGNGEDSKKQIKKIRKKLKKAFVHLSGMQQGVPLDDPQYIASKLEIQNIYVEIGKALGLIPDNYEGKTI